MPTKSEKKILSWKSLYKHLANSAFPGCFAKCCCSQACAGRAQWFISRLLSLLIGPWKLPSNYPVELKNTSKRALPNVQAFVPARTMQNPAQEMPQLEAFLRFSLQSLKAVIWLWNSTFLRCKQLPEYRRTFGSATWIFACYSEVGATEKELHTRRRSLSYKIWSNVCVYNS